MKNTSKFHLIVELYNLACDLDVNSFILMNKLVIKRKSNAFVTVNQEKNAVFWIILLNKISEEISCIRQQICIKNDLSTFKN